MKESSTGIIPNNFNDINVFVPSKNHIIHIAEGSGDSLDNNDYKNGYIDYIDFTVYDLNDDMAEIDGGNMLLKEYVQDKYKNLSECLPELMDFIYEDNRIKRIILI